MILIMIRITKCKLIDLWSTAPSSSPSFFFITPTNCKNLLQHLKLIYCQNMPTMTMVRLCNF